MPLRSCADGKGARVPYGRGLASCGAPALLVYAHNIPPVEPLPLIRPAPSGVALQVGCNKCTVEREGVE
jgi:hypothetical protein